MKNNKINTNHSSSNFQKAHSEWIQHHLALRRGERKSRLERGHRHGEQLFAINVWWPMFGNFNNLHPEYQVYDLYGQSKFLDFAFIIPYFKVAIEVDSYKTHILDVDREKHRRELRRHSFLEALGWKVMRFAYDDVQDKPEICIQLLQFAMGQIRPSASTVSRTTLIEKELIRLALSLARPIRPIDVVTHFEVNSRTARKWLENACANGWLYPKYTQEKQRVRSYEINPDKIKFFW